MVAANIKQLIEQKETEVIAQVLDLLCTYNSYIPPSLLATVLNLGVSGAENFLDELLNFFLIVQSVLVVGASAFTLLVQALELLGSLSGRLAAHP